KVHREQQKIQEQLEKSNRKTFRQCAQQYIEDNKAAWKNAKHAAQWASSLENYAHGVIGDVVVAEISTPMILEILRPIWIEKVETANRLRGRIETILSWAKVQGFRTGDNPAEWKGHLDQILPARTKIKKTVHHASMPYKEIPAYFKTLHEVEGNGAFALEFAILNASRAGEILNATWKEIDFEEKLWIIPANRMKAAREHRIPLTDEAIELLHTLPGYTLDKELRDDYYLFPSSSNRKALSNMAMTAVLRRTGKGEFTQHGFRSAFRDWAAEVVHYPREVIEHALAHKLADEVEAAYQRGDLLDKRRQLMKDWSIYCYSLLKNN
ncbi:MAG: tyrosine-type recombinase/integrase, partial [Saezia sp.]